MLDNSSFLCATVFASSGLSQPLGNHAERYSEWMHVETWCFLKEIMTIINKPDHKPANVVTKWMQLHYRKPVICRVCV